jgi:Na+-transporting methylmalonyl-CoA/oxaloacetate decarboxylase gamma subunit
MDNLSFGITLTVVGMGGTLATLWILGLVMNLIKRAFPVDEPDRSSESARKTGVSQ